MAIFEIFRLKPQDYHIISKVESKTKFVSNAFSSRVECLKICLSEYLPLNL